MKTPMTKASLILRIVYAVCLAGATCVHVATHVQYGQWLGALEGHGFSPATRFFWSSLTLLDPLAALLLFIRPPAGLALVGAIMVSDVAHNSWILIHFSWAPDAAYWAQVFFFCFCPRRLEWPGLGPDQ